MDKFNTRLGGRLIGCLSLQHVYDILYLEDKLACQVSSLTKSRACIRDLEDQARDAGEALQQHRSARERAEKSTEELRVALDAAQEDLRKNDRFCVEQYDISQKMSA